MNESTATKLTSDDGPDAIEAPRTVIEARVRELMPDTMKLSSEALNALNHRVATLVEDAVKRCKMNGRNTLKPQDF
jgi:histone H3/H4